jgi:nitrous-oxide reductase
MDRRTRALLIGAFITGGVVALVVGHGGIGGVAPIQAALPSAPLDQIMQDRGLTPDEAEAALKTFVPPGKHDEFMMITSSGQRGSILLYGIPSMRMLKEIPVYAPDTWQGWGQGDTDSAEVLKNGSFGKGLPVQTWGDLHHPQISLTNGKYDGEWVIATDKSAGRVAIISLRDFKTKNIFKIPNANSDHHGVFTDNSEYIIVSTFFPTPFNEANGYAPIEQYQAKYRGLVSFLRFDRVNGRIWKPTCRRFTSSMAASIISRSTSRPGNTFGCTS